MIPALEQQIKEVDERLAAINEGMLKLNGISGTDHLRMQTFRCFNDFPFGGLPARNLANFQAQQLQGFRG